MKGNHSTVREGLVALNAAPTLDRSSICRLAADLSIWAGREGHATDLAAELGVTGPALEKGWRELDQAAETADRECRRAGAVGARLVTRLDDDYPLALFDLDLPPPVLYCLGTIPFGGPSASIVGSRRASPYGLEAARFFSTHLARSGAVVVSGLARGIDSAAHRAAIEVEDGSTIAVLGCGIDRCYPQSHRRLEARIAGTGAVVAEFPIGAPPVARNFPVRNRIIAALGQCTLVVEATPRSGSLITARLALELGRDIFAVPGRLFDESALGTNALIRDGAFLALHPDDLLRAAGGEPSPPAATESSEREPPLDEIGRKVWRAMTPGETTSAEALAATAGAPLPQIVASLLELELAGWVERFPGPVYGRRGAWR